MSVTMIEPPNWWTGMNWNQVQLMLYGRGLGRATVQSAMPHLKVLRTHRTPNPDYLFVDCEIAPNALDGLYLLTVEGPSDTLTLNYPILRRKNPTDRYQGFGPADIIYLIQPDRFADGDTANDAVPGMLEGANRDTSLGRFGGDIQGIIQKLEYLTNLGVTTLWINPLIENNNPEASYHGYSATNLYNIDPRYGTNQLYELLVHEAHQRGLKVILDHVSNHISIAHPWMKGLPMPDWINGTAVNHQRTNHMKAELVDPYSDPVLQEITVDGWFNDQMPDLNQTNPFVKKYLIQNTLWWIELCGLDGIREDTAPYVDQQYLAAWNAAILNEYPDFNIVGEVWINDPVFVAPFQHRSRIRGPFDSGLPAVTDFGLFDAFMQVFGNHASIRTIYDCIAKDFLYGDPGNLVTFLDNHDVRRIMYVTQADTQRAKLALTLLLTTRGIPEILYGTEIGMMGGRDHGTIRSPFPGGFPHDTRNAFIESGRTSQERAIYNALRTLIHLRRNHRALAYGRTVHYPPMNEVYIYFRETRDEKIMVVANNRSEEQRVNLSPIRHRFGNARQLRNLVTGEVVNLKKGYEVTVGGSEAGIYLIE